MLFEYYYSKNRITSYNVCYTKLLRISATRACGAAAPAGLNRRRVASLSADRRWVTAGLRSLSRSPSGRRSRCSAGFVPGNGQAQGREQVARLFGREVQVVDQDHRRPLGREGVV